MSLNEVSIKIPGEYIPNVFGQFDAFAKKIERTLHVTLVLRDDSLKIIGAQGNIEGAKEVFEQLIALAERGNVITEQNVNYALALLEEHRGSEIVEIDKDIICHTINGKPVKPKTIGQKEYVDAIRKKMIVFGMGPAGTGKTYLAMAMAITAFKNEQVGRIILTRPVIQQETILVGNFLIHSIRHLFHGIPISQGEGIQNRIAEHTTPELQRPPE